MSNQDNEVCGKCARPCGYDDGKVSWQGFILCRQCKKNMIRKYCAFFGLSGISSSDSGIEIEWQDIDKILSRIKSDYALRVSFLVTDKELYEKEKTSLVSILEDY